MIMENDGGRRKRYKKSNDFINGAKKCKSCVSEAHRNWRIRVRDAVTAASAKPSQMSMNICQANRLRVTKSAVQAWAESLTLGTWRCLITASLQRPRIPGTASKMPCLLTTNVLTRSPNWRHKGSASWRKKQRGTSPPEPR